MEGGTKMNSKSNESNMERALRQSREDTRAAKNVKEKIAPQLYRLYNIDYFVYLDQLDEWHRAYVFFLTEKDLEEAKRSGKVEEIKAIVKKETEAGGCDSSKVAFEFDSE